MAITTMKGIKELGWDKISLSGQGFKGAVKSYINNKGVKVALCFNSSEAFIVEDNIGLFSDKDLYDGIIREKSIDIESTGYIEGATTLAFMDEDDMIVMLNDEDCSRVGLTEDALTDIKSRVADLYGFLSRVKDVIG